MRNLILSALNSQKDMSNTLIWLWGQSNTATLLADNPPVELQGVLSNSFMFTGGSFDPLEFTVNTAGTGQQYNQYYGIELRLSRLLPQPNYFGKHYKGSTSLAVDWVKGGALRNALINAINTALSIKDRDVWFLTNQWESDSNATDAPNYYTNLNEFLTDVQLETKPFEKIVITRATEDSNFGTYAPDIISAQEQYASENANTVVVNSDGLGYVDLTHWDDDSVEVMAQRNYSLL
jgi:hypothetical protein